MRPQVALPGGHKATVNSPASDAYLGADSLGSQSISAAWWLAEASRALLHLKPWREEYVNGL
jgi:hypothetical protein